MFLLLHVFHSSRQDGCPLLLLSVTVTACFENLPNMFTVNNSLLKDGGTMPTAFESWQGPI
jgi:hypothetical protein